jgi:hypothetical protein
MVSSMRNAPSKRAKITVSRTRPTPVTMMSGSANRVAGRVAITSSEAGLTSASGRGSPMHRLGSGDNGSVIEASSPCAPASPGGNNMATLKKRDSS